MGCWKVALLSVVVACGSGGLPDTTVTFKVGMKPSLIAFRADDDTDWRRPTAIDDETYRLAVHGPYTVVAVCEPSRGWLIETWQTARTLDDPHEVSIDPYCTPLPDQPSHLVTGKLLQDGHVQLGRADDSAFEGEPFSLRVVDGTYDLIAAMAHSATHFVIRRDQVIAADTDLPAIDFLTEGVPLVDLPLTVTNPAPGEGLSAILDLRTKSTFAPIYFGTPASFRVAPASALRASDSMRAEIISGHYLRTQTAIRTLAPGASTTFTLPNALALPRFELETGQLVAAWGELPDYDFLQLTLSASGGEALQLHVIDCSASYIQSTGISAATFHTDIPGYQSSWRIDFSQEYVRGGSTTKQTEDTLLQSQTDEIVPPTAPQGR